MSSHSLGAGAVLVGYWLGVSVAVLPVLGVADLRDRLAGWPTRWFPANYLLATAVLVLTHVVVVLGATAVRGGLSGDALLQWFVDAAAVAGGAWWVLGALVAPAAGWWELTNRQRLLLALGAAWYVAISVVTVVVLVVVAVAFFFPSH